MAVRVDDDAPGRAVATGGRDTSEEGPKGPSSGCGTPSKRNRGARLPDLASRRYETYDERRSAEAE